MKNVNKILIGALVLAVLNLNVATVVLAADPVPAMKDTITKNPPEMLASPEMNIPAGKKVEGKKSYTWLWWVLGAVVVGAAAAGGGGGGGGGDSSTGGVSVGW
jgi:predicted phage tail protein